MSSSKTARAMSEQMDELKTQLKNAGITVSTGKEAAARHDEIVELVNLVISPMVPVPDKITLIDALIMRQWQWGRGRVDRFWGFVYNTWLEGLHEIWIPNVEVCAPAVEWLYDVEIVERTKNKDNEDREETKTLRIHAETVLYFRSHPARYVRVGEPKVAKVQHRKTDPYESPNENYEQDYEECLLFGMMYVLRWAKMIMSYVQHPDDINKSNVFVIQGVPSLPPTYPPKPETPGVPTP